MTPCGSMIRSSSFAISWAMRACTEKRRARGNANVIAGDSFAIDDARARAQACQRLDDQREATDEVVAWTTVEPRSRAVLPGDSPKAVMLDLMKPLA
jgi:hypothetical protein